MIEQVTVDPLAPDSDLAANDPFGWVTIEQISGVVEVNITGSPEVADAVKGLRTPISRFAGVVKLIVCGALAPG